MDTTLSIILPTFNEAENIVPLIQKIQTLLHPTEILVVDDNSPDGTAQLVIKKFRHERRVEVLLNQSRLGLTQSLQQGISAAKGKYVGWMDADFSHPPELLPQLFAAAKISDVVVGSWLVAGGRDQRKEKGPRMFSWLINTLCQICFGTFVHAYTSGFIVTKSSIVRDIPLHGDYGEYCIDFLVRCHRQQKNIREIPFDCISRQHGETKTAPNMATFVQKGTGYITTIIRLLIEGIENR